MSKIIKRVLSFVLIFSLIFFVVFLGFNKAKETKAMVFPAVALGVGALGALVSAYFATAGVQFSGSASTDGDYLGNYVANWVKSSGSFANNPYFNSSGEFIGSSDDLSIVQNEDNDLVSLIFGKEFAVWLEALKQLFVSEKNLDADSSTTLDSGSFVSLASGDAPYYPYSTVTYPSGGNVYYLNYGNYTNALPFNEPTTFIIDEDSTISLYVYANGSNSQYSYTYRIDNNGAIRQNTVPINYGNLVFFSFSNTVSGDLVFQNWVSSGVGQQYRAYNGLILNNVHVNDLGVLDITLDGALTDGYDDFEEAINTDLDSDDEDLVVGVGVGDFADTLDPVAILDGILDKIISGTLNPTYEGSFDNQKEAEEELEGSKPFVPVLPNGWVQVEGLQSFFPFCIPFDLYNVIALLNVPPEAPQFTWKMGFGSQFEPYDVEIDLSPYETVAQVFRIMVVIGFLLFLILKTRDLIRG